MMSTRTFVHRLLIVLLVGAVAYGIWRITDVFLLVFAAVLLAILLRGLTDFIGHHTGLGGGWSLLAAVIVVALPLGLGGWLVGAEVSTQVGQLTQSLPAAWNDAKQWLQGQPWGHLLLNPLRAQGSSSPVQGVLSQLGSVAMTALGGLTDVVLVIIAALYLAGQPGLYRQGLVMLVPPEGQQRAGEVLATTRRALLQWLGGQLISMTMVGILTTGGLWLLDLPAALALGLFAALAEFVPMVGPIVAAVPAILLAFTLGPSMALYVALLYLAIQQVESYLIMPLVQRRMVELPPALVLFTVVAFGLLFGVMGVVLATPLTVVAFVWIKMLYVKDTLGEETPVPGGEASRQKAA